MVARNSDPSLDAYVPPDGDVPMEQQQADESAPSLSESETRQGEDRQAPSGSVVYLAICREGLDELKRPSSALAWSGLAAGLSMGFSLVTEGLLRSHLPDTPWRPLITKFGYSIGFLIVILGRQQLFTENTLTVILPMLSQPRLKTLANVARLWGVVLGSNLVGAMAFAAVIAHTSVFAPEVRHGFEQLGFEGMDAPFGPMLLRGIFAGWLIALMVWLLPFAESFRVLVIILVTYVVALGHFSHVIAGSVDTFYLLCRGQISIGRWLGGFFVPTFLGNAIGGVTLVAMVNHAQVKSGGGGEDA